MNSARVLRPSGMKTWANCSGSPQLIEALELPPEDMTQKPDTVLGTVVHHIVEECFLNGASPEQFELRNVKAPGGYSSFITSDLIEGVKVYLGYVNSLRGSYSTFKVEQFYSLAYLGVRGLKGGTCDFIAFDTDKRIVEIVDLKNGVRNVVLPELNWQLMQYVVGFFINELSHVPEEELRTWGIRLTIIQPRGLQDEAIAHWDTSYPQIWQWAETVLVPSAERTHSPDAELNPSEDACQWCRAKAQCPAYQELMAPLIDLLPIEKEL